MPKETPKNAPTADTDTPVAEAPAEKPAATKADTSGDKEFPLPLVEFCARLSATDRRVEMIGAFHASEKAAGHLKDLESAYRARYAAFCNAPA